MSNNNWSPNKNDIVAICETIEENFYEDGGDYKDHCAHCWTEYLFFRERTDEQYKNLPHEQNCVVLKARDILTRINE